MLLFCRADNHAVREAACQCIAELAAKIDSSVLGVHVDRLLDTLVDCFNDDSWPVRDMACVASGKFVLNYPKEVLTFKLSKSRRSSICIQTHGPAFLYSSSNVNFSPNVVGLNWKACFSKTCTTRYPV